MHHNRQALPLGTSAAAVAVPETEAAHLALSYLGGDSSKLTPAPLLLVVPRLQSQPARSQAAPPPHCKHMPGARTQITHTKSKN